MFLSDSYLNINYNSANLQNLKQSDLFPIRNVKTMKNLFDLKSGSASLVPSNSQDFYTSYTSRSERNAILSMGWKEVQKKHKNKLAGVYCPVCPVLLNLPSGASDLAFQNAYHFFFLNRITLFDILLNSIWQKFNQTLLCQKFLNTLTFNKAEKTDFTNSNTGSSLFQNTSKSCFERNFSTSQLSNFSQNTSLSFKGNFIRQHQSSIFFMEFHQYFLKASSDVDIKAWLTLDSLLSNEFFFKAHKFLNFFLCTLGLEKLDARTRLNKKNENVGAKFLQNSIINSKLINRNFFVFKEIFYLFAYSTMHEFYVKDSNAKVLSLNFNVFKVGQNRDLSFAFLLRKKQESVPENPKSFSTATFFNLEANNYSSLQLNLESTIKNLSLEKGLLKSTFSKHFGFNKTNLNINQMFADNLRFAWLHLNLKLTIKPTSLDLSSNDRGIQKSLFINSFYTSRQLPFSVLYLLEGAKDPPHFKKILKTKSWALMNLKLLPYGYKFPTKPLLNSWAYFFTNPDLLMLLLAENDYDFQNIHARPIVGGWAEWFLSSLKFLNFSNITPKEKNLHNTFLNLNLLFKNKVKQKVVSDLLNHRVVQESLLRDFKYMVKNSGSLKQSDLILKLTSLLYIYSYCFLKDWDWNSVRRLDKEIFNCLWKWACRRHNNKSKKWIRSKYFSRLTPNLWVFGCSEEAVGFDLNNKNNKVLENSSGDVNFLYLPRLSQIVFHLTKGLSKKFK